MDRPKSISLKPMLPKELTMGPKLIPVVVAEFVGEKKQLQRVFSSTQTLTKDLKHLRRVRDQSEGNLECVIAKVESTNELEQLDELQKLEKLFEPEKIFKNYRIAYLPASSPKTIEQFHLCSPIWPCKFSKSEYLEKVIDGKIISELEYIELNTIVHHVVKLISAGDSKINSLAVIFRASCIYGAGLASAEARVTNPTKHPTMLAIDSVARRTGGGHWKDHDADELIGSLQQSLENEEDLKSHKDTFKNDLPYLCTDYDVFLTEEPCSMCTMGLIQSRVRRLYYLSSESNQTLSNCLKVCFPDESIEVSGIHRLRSLNHNFEAWKLTLNHTDDLKISSNLPQTDSKNNDKSDHLTVKD